MLMHKLKIASVMILSLGTFVVGAGALFRVASADGRATCRIACERSDRTVEPTGCREKHSGKPRRQ